MSSPRPFHKRLRDQFVYGSVRMLLVLLRALPRKTTIASMRFLARIGFWLARKERLKTMAHLSLAFGSQKSRKEIEQLACGVFEHFATAFVDFVRLDEFVAHDFQGLVSCRGLENLQELARNGKGVIALTGHFGNWELLGAYLAHKGIPLRVVGKSMRDPRLDQILVSTRNQAGYTNIARGKDTREILRALQRGDALGMLIDQDTKVAGIFVDFFGLPAHTPVAPAVLARKYDVPIVPIFMWLKEDLTYQLECMAPLGQSRTGDQAHDLHATIQLCSDAYEKIIREHPEQWAWMHNRWKTQPAAAS